MPSRKKAATSTADVAGAGLGTGIIGLAAHLPTSLDPYKELIVYAAPAISVGGRILYIIASSYVSYVVTKFNIDRALKETIRVRDRIMSDQKSSEEHKKLAQDTVEQMEKLKLEMLSADMEHVTARLKELKEIAL